MRVELVSLDEAALAALAAGDRTAAETATGLALTAELVAADHATWRRRLAQVRADPAVAAWVTGLVVDRDTGVVVGRAGFHAPPDRRGMVEVGYSISPSMRRRGYAAATLAALVERAREEPSVTVVRASISPDNEASWRTVAPFGFERVGEQWDDEDGLEIVVELPACVGSEPERVLPRLVSVNVGPPKPVDYATSLDRTSIDKRPVVGPVAVRTLGLAGDSVSDTRHHGGEFQAVYAYAGEDLERWSGELGRELWPGAFGENLTTEGIDLNACELGETWAVGTALLRVVAVRTPCRTFQGWLGHHGFDDRGWVRRFTEAARPGAYLKVVEEGSLSVRDRIDVRHRPGHGVTVGTMFRAWTTDPGLLPLLLQVEGLSEVAYDRARRHVRRRTDS